jgi:hypothetical protein
MHRFNEEIVNIIIVVVVVVVVVVVTSGDEIDVLRLGTRKKSFDCGDNWRMRRVE